MSYVEHLVWNCRVLARRAARLQRLWSMLPTHQRRALLYDYPEIREWFDKNGVPR